MWFSKWISDGTEVMGNRTISSPDHKEEEQWYAINPATQTIREIPAPPTDSDGLAIPDADTFDSGLPFRLTAKPNASPARTSSLWLESTDGHESVLVTGDGTALGVTKFAGLYTMAGALYVAPIREISVPALTRLRQDSARKAAMEKADSINNALLGYVYAHANLYPEKDAGLSKALGFPPDPAILADFTYQPPASRKMTKHNDPSTTVLGFVSAGGGRAVIYTDGSVKWLDGG